MNIRYEDKQNEFSARNGHRVYAHAHLHSHIELVYMIDGHASAWVDDRKYSLIPGDIFITFPNQVHRYESYGTENYIILIFPKDMCPEFNLWFQNCVPKRARIHKEEYEGINLPELIHNIFYLNNNLHTKLDQIVVKGFLLSLLGYLFGLMEFEEEKTAEVSAIKQLLNFCSENYTQDLSLELLEKELHINRFYISHLFSKKLKMKFNDYINSLRVYQACQLLKESDMSITAIWQEVGFSTPRTFNRAFMQIMGQTPSNYRSHYRDR